jgi:hypothetical protein
MVGLTRGVDGSLPGGEMVNIGWGKLQPVNNARLHIRIMIMSTAFEPIFTRIELSIGSP